MVRRSHLSERSYDPDVHCDVGTPLHGLCGQLSELRFSALGERKRQHQPVQNGHADRGHCDRSCLQHILSHDDSSSKIRVTEGNTLLQCPLSIQKNGELPFSFLSSQAWDGDSVRSWVCAS